MLYRATVYDPEGNVVQRTFKGNVVGELVFERDSAHRAWLSARSFDFPAGVEIKVTHQPKPVPGTSLQADERLLYHRRWDGERWIEVATGEPVP
jgi:hypothetical protein